MMPPTLARRWTVIPIAALIVFGATGTALAQANSVTLAWDAIPEHVAGYFVFVTRQPEAAEMRFDAGPATQFTYRGTDPGVGYSFAVAAYTADGLVGSRSSTVFFLGGSGADQGGRARVQPGQVFPTAATAETGGTVASSSRDVRRVIDGTVCTEDGSFCFNAQAVLSVSDAAITAVSGLPDGRVLVVKDHRRIEIVGDAGVAAPAFVADEGVEILSVAVDPAFAETRALVVALAERLADGSRQMTLARYREVGGTLGQRAALVSNLRVPPTGAVPVTVDISGRIYVAVPGVDAAGRASPEPYASRLLRFEADGSAGRDNPGASPVLTSGFARPSALAWDDSLRALWMSGHVDPSAIDLARVDVDRGGEMTFVAFPDTDRRQLETLVFDSSRPVAGLAVDEVSSSLIGLTVQDGRASTSRFVLPEQSVRLVGRGAAQQAFVVIRDTGNESETLVRLSPR